VSEKEKEHLTFLKSVVSNRLADISENRESGLQHSHSWYRMRSTDWSREGFVFPDQERARLSLLTVLPPIPGVQVEASIDLVIIPRRGAETILPETPIDNAFDKVFDGLKSLENCVGTHWNEGDHTKLAEAREKLAEIYWKVFANDLPMHREVLARKAKGNINE